MCPSTRTLYPVGDEKHAWQSACVKYLAARLLACTDSACHGKDNSTSWWTCKQEAYDPAMETQKRGNETQKDETQLEAAALADADLAPVVANAVLPPPDDSPPQPDDTPENTPSGKQGAKQPAPSGTADGEQAAPSGAAGSAQPAPSTAGSSTDGIPRQPAQFTPPGTPCGTPIRSVVPDDALGKPTPPKHLLYDARGNPMSMKPEAVRMRFNRAAKSHRGVPEEVVARFSKDRDALYQDWMQSGEDWNAVALKELTEQVTERSLTNRCHRMRIKQNFYIDFSI